jgi:hypothetical protein
MALTIVLTEDDAAALYNAIYVAEKHARGKKDKETARVGMAVAMRLGLPYKHDLDEKE